MGKEVTSVTITDNTGLVREALETATRNALEAIGFTAERYAKELLSGTAPQVWTSRLKNSITHVTKSKSGETLLYTKEMQEAGQPATPLTVTTSEPNTVYIGSAVHYAKYIELGTGIYASEGNGRKEPWWYYDERTGKFVFTHGSKPYHFLRKAVTEHTGEFREIVKAAFKANE